MHEKNREDCLENEVRDPVRGGDGDGHRVVDTQYVNGVQ